MKKLNASTIKLDVGQASDKGKVRKENEDSFGWFSVPSGELFVVADGMGGHKGGAFASSCAIKAFREHFSSHDGPPDELLLGALVRAEKSVLELSQNDPSLTGCGTTVVALLVQDSVAWFLHVGDSRLYIYSGNHLYQVGRDHSAVEDMLEAGLLSLEEARSYPKNIITQSIGGKIDYNRCTPVKIAFDSSEKFLLCTDGLWGVVSHEAIEKMMSSKITAKEKCEILISDTLNLGAPDNVTLQIIQQN